MEELVPESPRFIKNRMSEPRPTGQLVVREEIYLSCVKGGQQSLAVPLSVASSVARWALSNLANRALYGWSL